MACVRLAVSIQVCFHNFSPNNTSPVGLHMDPLLKASKETLVHRFWFYVRTNVCLYKIHIYGTLRLLLFFSGWGIVFFFPVFWCVIAFFVVYAFSWSFCIQYFVVVLKLKLIIFVTLTSSKDWKMSLNY